MVQGTRAVARLPVLLHLRGRLEHRLHLCRDGKVKDHLTLAESGFEICVAGEWHIKTFLL